jgi:hypothetical protein
MLVCVFLCAACTRDLGCSAHPAFPAPSSFLGRSDLANLGRSMPRERGLTSRRPRLVRNCARGAGTHTARSLSLALRSMPSIATNAKGYGSPRARRSVRGTDSSNSNDSSSQSRVESARNFQRSHCCKHLLRLDKTFPGQPCACTGTTEWGPTPPPAPPAPAPSSSARDYRRAAGGPLRGRRDNPPTPRRARLRASR